MKDELEEGVEEGVSTGRVVRECSRLRDSVSYLISDKGDKVVRIHIQSNKKGMHNHTSWIKGREEEESWFSGYRAASRISTLTVQSSVSRLYPEPGGLTFRSKLNCKEVKPITVSPSKGVFTRILPFLQYRVMLYLS